MERTSGVLGSHGVNGILIIRVIAVGESKLSLVGAKEIVPGVGAKHAKRPKLCIRVDLTSS